MFDCDNFIHKSSWLIPPKLFSASLGCKSLAELSGDAFPRFAPSIPHKKPCLNFYFAADKLCQATLPAHPFLRSPQLRLPRAMQKALKTDLRGSSPLSRSQTNLTDFRKAVLSHQPNGTWHRIPTSPCLKGLGKIILGRWSTISSLPLAKRGWVTTAVGTVLMDGTSRKSGKGAFKVQHLQKQWTQLQLKLWQSPPSSPPAPAEQWHTWLKCKQPSL